MNHVRVVVLSVVLTAALIGCTPVTPEPAPSETVAAPSPTPTPEPTKPELSELVLTANGLGPLVLGQAPPVTSPDVDILVFDEDFCVDYEGPEGEVLPGLWVTNYPEVSDGFYGNPGGAFDVLVVNGLVARIDVKSAQIATPDGIRIGSTLDEVLAAYPDSVAPDSQRGGSDLYVIEGSAGRLLVEVTTDDRIDGYWNSEEIDRVFGISAWGLDLEPRGVSGSDNTVGNCTTA